MSKSIFNKYEKKFMLPCDCGCGIMVVSKLFEDDGFISYYESAFYAYQRPGKYNLIESLKAIWFFITGKRYRLYDISVTPEKWEEFKKFIAET